MQKQILALLRKRAMSGKGLTRVMKRDRARVLAVCKGLESAGQIVRDGQVWRIKPGAQVPEFEDSHWTLNAARDYVSAAMFTKGALADPDDPTVVGRTRRIYDEACVFLQLHDPAFVLELRRTQEQATKSFLACWQAYAHDRPLFDALVAMVVEERFELADELIALYRIYDDPLLEGRRPFFLSILSGRTPLLTEFTHPHPPAPKRDVDLLQMAYNVAASEDPLTDGEIEWLFDMLVTLDPRAVLQAFLRQDELQHDPTVMAANRRALLIEMSADADLQQEFVTTLIADGSTQAEAQTMLDRVLSEVR